jgi:hypothetical protein
MEDEIENKAANRFTTSLHPAFSSMILVLVFLSLPPPTRNEKLRDGGKKPTRNIKVESIPLHFISRLVIALMRCVFLRLRSDLE